MKHTILVLAALAVGFGVAWLVLPSQDSATATAPSGGNAEYTCGMHPEIASDEPGYCPICEMKLTPRKESGGSGGVAIDPATSQSMGLATAPARYERLERAVRAFGRVEFDEKRRYGVNLKFEGWIEKLHVGHEGATVQRGDPLAEIYAPALVAAQRELLIARRAFERARREGGSEAGRELERLAAAARLRLTNWDMSERQILALEQSGEPTRTVTLHSPASGVVVAKKVSEGDRPRPGAELFEIADMSEVWVTAHVYEQDLPFVRVGQTATVALEGTRGETLTARVSWVSPYLDASRQAEIRLDVSNQDSRLKPEMYAEVSISAELEEGRLAIPRAAVINSGERELVYVSSGDGRWTAREIETGAAGDGDLVEVVAGLSAGQDVIVSGQFLLDSESRLSEALSEMTHDHGSADYEDRSGHEEEASPPGVYTCPMPVHFHVVQYGEGECGECGMDLVPIEETDNDRAYVCPMRECGVAQDGPGNCPVCGMKLAELERGHDR